MTRYTFQSLLHVLCDTSHTKYEETPKRQSENSAPAAANASTAGRRRCSLRSRSRSRAKKTLPRRRKTRLIGGKMTTIEQKQSNSIQCRKRSSNG